MVLLWLVTSALPCGGLFCNNASPVDQAAEEIVFAFDAEAGDVEMHIQIAWEGRSEDFAWVVPVPAEPWITLSDQGLFDALRVATNPFYDYLSTAEGRCGPPQLGCTTEQALSAIDLPQDGVEIVGTADVGPFETVTLQADSSQALVDWLQVNDYDLPMALEPALAPYVAQGSYFVAMRLSADADTGDIEPIALHYPATTLSIPIQLTAIAAADDMPVRVYVLADHRAVPESYLEVEINEAAIDWLDEASNYPQVLAGAVDAAGGQAFVTEFAGTTTSAVRSLDRVYDVDQGALLSYANRYPYLTRMTTALSADEMTVDPTFVLNPDLPMITNLHGATLWRDCRGTGDRRAPMHIELEDGRIVQLGRDGDTGSRDRIRDLEDVPAIAVYDAGADHRELIVDFSEEAERSLRAHNRAVEQGCGCSIAPLPTSFLGAGFLAVVAGIRRRRRAG